MRAALLAILARAGYDAKGNWHAPHKHFFDSDIHYSERPSALGCECGAMLVRDPDSELWEVQ